MKNGNDNQSLSTWAVILLAIAAILCTAVLTLTVLAYPEITTFLFGEVTPTPP